MFSYCVVLFTKISCTNTLLNDYDDRYLFNRLVFTVNTTINTQNGRKYYNTNFCIIILPAYFTTSMNPKNLKMVSRVSTQ